MKDKNVYFFVAAALAIIVPVPGRFAYGLLMLLLFNIQNVTGVLFCHLIAFFKLEDLKNSLVAIELIAVTILYKQLLVLLCPVAAFSLGFLLYLPALSSVIVEFSFKDNSLSLSEDLRKNCIRNLIFSVAALVVFLLRDIIGFGTITFPVWNKIATFHFVQSSHATYASAFIATVPGAFVIVALILFCYIYANRQFNRIERSGGNV
ncbi:MAG: hypothetical protein IKS40_07225 [Treponema sp.]|nr:hypothetical protein [Treponema sp.]